MKNTTIFFFVFLLVIVTGILVFSKTEILSGKVVKETSDSNEIQKITLSMKNYNYYPNTIKVKINQPVRIYLDKSVVGCYRGFIIRDFGVAKYLKTPEDYVEFTPTKIGSFRFACTMGMGTGTLIVYE